MQGWAKEWSLGCVNPASWLPLAAGGEFTQPRDHSLAQPCILLTWLNSSSVVVNFRKCESYVSFGKCNILLLGKQEIEPVCHAQLVEVKH